MEETREVRINKVEIEKDEKVEEQLPQNNSEEITRESLSLSHFFDDMSLLGRQVRKTRNKPIFFYGDLSVTNYLLWLMLGELMRISDDIKKLKGGEK